MRLVVIESPFAGDVARNLRYLRACMADALARGEAPYASHALYTQPGVLDDGRADDRNLGIRAGFAWRDVADATIVYTDLGITPGMGFGIKAAQEQRERERAEILAPHYGASTEHDRVMASQKAHALEYRELGAEWEALAVKREQGFVTRWPQ